MLGWREIAARAGGGASAGWTRLAADLGRAVAKSAVAGGAPACPRPAFLLASEPLPFEVLLTPIVHLARTRLRAAVGADTHDLLGEPAWGQLQRWLLRRLLAAGHDALFREWEKVRAPGRWRAFVATHRADGLATLFARYPVLARLWAETVARWVRFVARVLRRLIRDWPALRRRLLPRLPPAPRAGVVAAVATGLSDPHDGGATVLVLTLRPGGRVVYKPRSLSPDAAYYRLLAALNRAADAGAGRFRVVKILTGARHTHGWMRCVASASCRDRAGVRRFYRRAGAALCLHFLLRAVDGHEDNWIAAGEQPVAIDLETLWHPAFAGGPGVGNTVARTGILPLDGYAYPLLGRARKRRRALPAERWRQVNTDAMRRGRRRVSARRETHLPRLGRRTVPLDLGLAKDVLAGFTAMADRLAVDPDARAALARCVAELTAPALTRQRRWLARPTPVYTALLRRARAARCLRDGRARAQVFAALRPHRGAAAPAALLVAEIRALENLDVPRISAAACGASPPTALPAAVRRALIRQRRVLAQLLDGRPEVVAVSDYPWRDAGRRSETAAAVRRARANRKPC